MARHKAILQSNFPYNITARCINREWFNLPMEAVWEIFCSEICKAIKEKNLVVHSFVLMSNHFHLIASTPLANISECMHQIMTNSSRRLTRHGNRINETFAGRHHKCVLDSYYYYLNAYKYNYRNPVEAGLTGSVEDYKFTTLRGLLFPSEIKIPICEDTLFQNTSEALQWLNTSPEMLKQEAVKFALKRAYFRAKKNRKNGVPVIMENEIL